MSPDTLKRIVLAVTREFGSDPDSVMASTRRLPVDSRARAVAMSICYDRMQSYTDVGKLFERDRTTVRAAVHRVDRLVASGPVFCQALSRVLDQTNKDFR